jgi:hypothetical protein
MSSSPEVVRVDLKPRPSEKDKNELVVPLCGIRRLHVFLAASIDTRRESSDVWWVLSAWATLEDPGGDLPNLPNYRYVNLAPSTLVLPPLGAALMHVASLFWMAEPRASALSVKFSTAGDQPEGKAVAFGYPDTTPHDFAGFFRTPFGFAQAPARLVEPLPDDPEVLLSLQLEDRLPPVPVSRSPQPRRRRSS